MQSEFGYQRVSPCTVAYLPLGAVADVVSVVAEVIGHGIFAFDETRSAVYSGVVHIDAYATVIHKCSHSCLLCGSGVSRQTVGHVVPVVTGIAKVSTL